MSWKDRTRSRLLMNNMKGVKFEKSPKQCGYGKKNLISEMRWKDHTRTKMYNMKDTIFKKAVDSMDKQRKI